eukprot:m.143313 g.143313  ORF g.143313 m.143313 type:complete len:713 (-) comp14895_c0_seq11:265-2403(-)
MAVACFVFVYVCTTSFVQVEKLSFLNDNITLTTEQTLFDAAGGNDTVGKSMALSDTKLAVSYYTLNGAHKDGAVDVYDLTGPNRNNPQYILHPENQESTQFGRQVLFWREMLFISAPQAQNPKGRGGAVYIYNLDFRGRYKLNDTLYPASESDNDNFGYAMAINEDGFLIVGAFGDNLEFGGFYDGSLFDLNYSHLSKTNRSGAAYLYKVEKDKAVFQTFIKNEQTVFEQFFGFSVAISKDRFVIGATGSHENCSTHCGLAFVYALYPIIQKVSTLTPPNNGSDDAFGITVAIVEDYVAVGSFTDAYLDRYVTIGPNLPPITEYRRQLGGVYLYEKLENSYDFFALLQPKTDLNFTRFGSHLQIQLPYVVVTAVPPPGAAYGALAYIFQISQENNIDAGNISGITLLDRISTNNGTQDHEIGTVAVLNKDILALSWMPGEGKRVAAVYKIRFSDTTTTSSSTSSSITSSTISTSSLLSSTSTWSSSTVSSSTESSTSMSSTSTSVTKSELETTVTETSTSLVPFSLSLSSSTDITTTALIPTSSSTKTTGGSNQSGSRSNTALVATVTALVFIIIILVLLLLWRRSLKSKNPKDLPQSMGMHDNPMFNESRPPLPPTPISTNVTPVRNPNQPPVTSTPYYSTPSDPPPQSLIKHARNPNYSELSDAAKYNQSPSASSRGETPFYSTLDDPDGTMYNTPLASPSAEVCLGATL